MASLTELDILEFQWRLWLAMAHVYALFMQDDAGQGNLLNDERVFLAAPHKALCPWQSARYPHLLLLSLLNDFIYVTQRGPKLVI